MESAVENELRMWAGSATRNRAADIKRACIVERIDILSNLYIFATQWLIYATVNISV